MKTIKITFGFKRFYKNDTILDQLMLPSFKEICDANFMGAWYRFRNFFQVNATNLLEENFERALNNISNSYGIENEDDWKTRRLKIFRRHSKLRSHTSWLTHWG